MRVSCACPKDLATASLEGWIRHVGLQPIITDKVIRCVYEGDDRTLGEAIVQMFEHERDHEITVFYSKEEEEASAKRAVEQPLPTHLGRRAKRKAKRRARNR